MEIRTEIEIAASAERVWDILVDFTRYPEWNPLVPEATGALRPGATVRLRVVAGREMRSAPVVLVVDPPCAALARRHRPPLCILRRALVLDRAGRSAAREVHAGRALQGAPNRPQVEAGKPPKARMLVAEGGDSA